MRISCNKFRNTKCRKQKTKLLLCVNARIVPAKTKFTFYKEEKTSSGEVGKHRGGQAQISVTTPIFPTVKLTSCATKTREIHKPSTFTPQAIL